MSTDSPTYQQAHHFDSPEHEYGTAKEGVWLFLTSEILMFGGLFVGYIIYASIYPEVFKFGSEYTDWRYGSINTIVLLTSSLTMVLGVHYCQVNKPKLATLNLLVTILCGFAFMGIKYLEYSHKIHEGLLPGLMYAGDTHGLDNMGLYFSFYFMMTGLHGIHVVAGMILIGWCAYRANRGDFSSAYFTPVEGVGLFWHLVDLIWIFLFPLLYLV